MWQGAPVYRSPQKPVIPVRVSLESVPDEARPFEGVVLAGIDDQLGLSSEAPERLVHLLRVQQRDVEVLSAAQKQRRGSDPVGVQEQKREFEPRARRLPGTAELRLVLPDVFISAVPGQDVRGPRPADRSLEAPVLRNDVIGQNPAVAPPAHTE